MEQKGEYWFQKKLFKAKGFSKLSQPKGRKVYENYEIDYDLGIVLSPDVGMRVHMNSSLHVNHASIMGINGSYFVDDHVSWASGRSYTDGKVYDSPLKREVKCCIIT